MPALGDDAGVGERDLPAVLGRDVVDLAEGDARLVELLGLRGEGVRTGLAEQLPAESDLIMKTDYLTG